MSLEAMETEQRCVEELWKASEIALAEKRRQQLALDWIAHHDGYRSRSTVSPPTTRRSRPAIAQC